jgi:hypothetical protein
VNAGKRIKSTIRLLDHYDHPIQGENVDNITISDTCLGREQPVTDTVFINCHFHRVSFRRSNFSNVTFVNCYFYGCHVQLQDVDDKANQVHILGCTSDLDNFLTDLSNHTHSEELSEEDFKKSEKYVLEKFWPVGKPNFSQHRPIAVLCSKSNQHSYFEITEAIKSLKKRNILLTPTNPEFLELNRESIPEVMQILERAS